MEKKIVLTSNAPAPQGAYSRSVKASGLVSVSGLPKDISVEIDAIAVQ